MQVASAPDGREQSLWAMEGGTAQPQPPDQASRSRIRALARLLPSPANQHICGGEQLHAVVSNLS